MTFERKKYKEFAKKQLSGRWTVPVLMTLFVVLISSLFSVPSVFMTFPSNFHNLQSLGWDYTSLLEDYAGNARQIGGTFILSVIESLVTFVFELSVLNVYLAMSRTPEKIGFSKFVEGFNLWGRAILTGLWYSLWLFIWSLIPIFIITIVVVIFAVLAATGSDASSFVAALIPLVTIAAMLPVIIKAIAYSQVFFLATEFQDLPVTRLLSISDELTKGHKWQLFVTELSFLGWFLLSALTLGILGLWVTPYYRMTMTNAYHALLKDALETGKITPEELAMSSTQEEDGAKEENPQESISLPDQNAQNGEKPSDEKQD